jgi:Uma2 family endonuclease
MFCEVMEMAEVAQKVLTWDEYVRGEPADLERYEIVDGVVIELPAPSIGHQRVVRRLLRLLEDFVSSRNLGEIFPAPLDVVVQRNPLRTRQPDLLFVRAENAPNLDKQQERLEFAPDFGHRSPFAVRFSLRVAQETERLSPHRSERGLACQSAYEDC